MCSIEEDLRWTLKYGNASDVHECVCFICYLPDSVCYVLPAQSVEYLRLRLMYVRLPDEASGCFHFPKANKSRA